jgi:RecA/RadA recombinase
MAKKTTQGTGLEAGLIPPISGDTPTRPKTAADLKKRFDKTKPRSIYTGSEIEGIVVPRLPSGSFVFDMLTAGGIPRNRITVFHGPKSSSKTTFALRLAGMFQTLNPTLTAAFVDFEGTFDWEWAKSYIPDQARLHVVRPDYGEEGIDMVKAYATEADDVGLIIIDSLAGIIPVAEAEADAADYTQLGLQVRLINRLLRILIPHMSQVNKQGGQLTVLAINQIRANMNKTGPYGSPYSQPGGKLLEHAASMDVKFYSGEYEKLQGIPVKVKHKFQVEKNKVGLPKRSGELAYYLTDSPEGMYRAGELDEDKVVITYAKRAGLINREGTKWVIARKGADPLVFDNMLALLRYTKEDQEFYIALKNATVRACIINPFLTGEEGNND